MKILHLEDNPIDAQLLVDLLAKEWPECEFRLVARRDEYIAELDRGGYDLIVSDFTLPAFGGNEALDLALARAPDVPFIFFSGTMGEDHAIAAVHKGAADYVLKDHVRRLPAAVRRALLENDEQRRRKQAERRVRELVDLLDRARDAIIVSEPGGRVTFWNQGAERITGLTADAATGRPIEELFGPEAHTKIGAARATLATAGEWRGEFNLRGTGGRAIEVEIGLTLIRDDAGHPKAHLCIATDITEKKKLEEQFLHAQRLESLGMLVAGIAHDLNNVLAPMLMAAPLLRPRAHDPADLQMLDMLERSAERGASLVRQILGFANGTSGGLQPTPVKHLLRDIGDVIRASFPKSIVFHEHLGPNLWLVRANPTQVHQVLLNLAINARDAMMPQGGTLTLRVDNRTLDRPAAQAIDGGRPGEFLVIEFIDTGSGIPPGTLPHIWEPFFTTKGEGKGNGLGLSTVRGIVARHGGFVTVDTNVGRGTTFRVFLPAEREGTGPIRPAAQSAPRGAGELILVVDDETIVRDMAAAILQRHGYRVVSGGDGVEAIALFIQHQAEIRLVISDINMPNLDGPALALVLKRLRADVKILAISGLGSSNAFNSPKPMSFAAAKLHKPFTPQALLVSVHSLLHSLPGTS